MDPGRLKIAELAYTKEIWTGYVGKGYGKRLLILDQLFVPGGLRQFPYVSASNAGGVTTILFPYRLGFSTRTTKPHTTNTNRLRSVPQPVPRTYMGICPLTSCYRVGTSDDAGRTPNSAIVHAHLHGTNSR